MRNILDITWFLRKPKLLGLILKGRPVSYSSFRNVDNLKNYVPKLGAIIDVGANKGQFTLAASHYFPQAKIYSFEPCKPAFKKFSKCFNNQSHVRAFDFGLGDTNGEIQFYENSFDQISSFLRIENSNDNAAYRQSEVQLTKATIRRLDDVYPSMDVVPPILLKLDVQGFEDRVLKGALKSLSNIDYVLLELAFEKLYENQLLFDDLYHLLNSLGYRFVAPLGFNYGDNSRIIEVDALFQKKE